MPWEVYEQPQGYQDLVYAMASLEGEEGVLAEYESRPVRAAWESVRS